VTGTIAADARRRLRPLVVVAAAVGAASLFANVVWNCNSCGWDLDAVPWYQALLVAAVPFVVSPIGVVILAIRAAIVRSRSTLLDLAGGSAGLALPWLYFVVGYVLFRS
jgi:hypothetical protein